MNAKATLPVVVLSLSLSLISCSALSSPVLGPTTEPRPKIEPTLEPEPEPEPEQKATAWVQVAEFAGISKAYRTDAPFEAHGMVRARYEFFFESAPSYNYGSLNIYPAGEDSLCSGAGPAYSQEWLGNSSGEVEFGVKEGLFCANFHPPDADWDRGELRISIDVSS
jgi:hypothetical protein